MTSITKPIPISRMNSAFNFNDYLYSSSPPALAFASILSAFDTPLLTIPCDNDNNINGAKKINYDKRCDDIINCGGNNKKVDNNENDKNNNKNTFVENTNGGGGFDLDIFTKDHKKKQARPRKNHKRSVSKHSSHHKNAKNTMRTLNITHSTNDTTTIITDTSDSATTLTTKNNRTQSYPNQGNVGSTRLKEQTTKRVCFADDKGKQLVHVKHFSDPVSISFPNGRERDYQNFQRQLRGTRVSYRLNLFDLCPNLIQELQEMKLEGWKDEEKKSIFAYYAQFSQPISCSHVLERKLREDSVSLESAVLNDGEDAVVGVIGFGEVSENISVKNADNVLKKGLRFKARVAVKTDSEASPDKKVFLRLTADKWGSFKDIEGQYQPPKNPHTPSRGIYIVSRSLKELCGKGGKWGENGFGGEDHDGLEGDEGCFPETVEFAVCFKRGDEESWDNNNSHNYRFCRFCK